MFWKIVSHQYHYYQPTFTHTITKYNAILVSSPLFYIKSLYYIEILILSTKLCCVTLVCVYFFDVYVVRKVNIAVKNDFNSLNEEWQKRKKLIVGILRSVNIFFHALCSNNNNNSQMKNSGKKIVEINCT